jgi:hypothetical protein
MSFFDLTSFLNIQKNYLNDLSFIQVVKNDQQLGQYINNVQTNLNTINTDYKDTNLANIDLNKNVNQVSTILDNENKYLTEKSAGIDSELTSQKRLIELNDSQRKKQSQYNYVILVIVISLILFILLMLIKKWLPFIPDGIISLLMILLLFFSITFITYLLYSISRRDHLNFDQIALSPPITSDSQAAKQNAINSGNLLQTMYNSNNCVGKDCCSVNSNWNPYINKCAFTCDPGKVDFNGNCILNADCTAGNNQVCGTSCIPNTKKCSNVETMTNLDITEKIKPFTPSEFIQYSTYKNNT